MTFILEAPLVNESFMTCPEAGRRRTCRSGLRSTRPIGFQGFDEVRTGDVPVLRSARAQRGEHALDDAIAAFAGEPEDLERGRVDVARQRVAQQRARPEQ